jgi:hypothetical protein
VGIGNFLVEEERYTLLGLGQEVGGEGSDPGEDAESGTSLEHEHGDDLLHEEANDDGGPGDLGTVVRRCVEGQLEEDQTNHGDGTVDVSRALRKALKLLEIGTIIMETHVEEREAISRAENGSQEGKPAKSKTSHVRELEERP